jgi:regulatory protein
MPGEALPSASDVRRVAMDALARREHSRQELYRKLLQRFTDHALIDRVLDDLRQENLQSDERYAEAFVRYRISKGQGPVRIAADLRSAGVEGEVINRQFENASGNWNALAREVYLKKFGPQPATDRKELARRQRFLQYRGFTSEQIQCALS